MTGRHTIGTHGFETMERKSLHETYTFEVAGDTVVAVPSGDSVSFDREKRAPDLERLRTAIGHPEVKHLIVDLSAGDYFGLDMLTEFESLAEPVRDRGGRTALCGLSEGTEQILGRSEFESRWEVFPTRRRALADVATISVSEQSARFVRPATSAARKLPGKLAPLAVVGILVLLIAVVGLTVMGLGSLLAEDRQEVRDFRMLAEVARRLRDGEELEPSTEAVRAQLVVIEKRYAAAQSGPEQKLCQAAEVCRLWIGDSNTDKWRPLANLYLASAGQGLELADSSP